MPCCSTAEGPQAAAADNDDLSELFVHHLDDCDDDEEYIRIGIMHTEYSRLYTVRS